MAIKEIELVLLSVTLFNMQTQMQKNQFQKHQQSHIVELTHGLTKIAKKLLNIGKREKGLLINIPQRKI